jgi:CHAT domain-containing protein/Tfp pilus assembly protein PilF
MCPIVDTGARRCVLTVLLIVETVLPERDAPHQGNPQDLVVPVFPGGQERTGTGRSSPRQGRLPLVARDADDVRCRHRGRCAGFRPRTKVSALMTRLLPRVLVTAAIVACSVHVQAPAVDAAQAGVIVEEVSAGSAGEKAGIRAGDVLLGWDRPASPPANPAKAEERIESVFDWFQVEMEQSPRGPVNVRGEREGKAAAFQVPMGEWGIRVHPRLDREALERYIDGKAAVASKQLERGIASWGEVVKSAESIHDVVSVCWMNLKIGDTWADAQRWKEAQAAYESARGMAETAGNVVARAIIWDSIGLAFERQNLFADAARAYESSLGVREGASAESLSLARSLYSLGNVAWRRGDLATAEAFSKRALVLREKLAPDSLDLARSLNRLGTVSIDRGDLAAAEVYHKRALAIRETLVPDSRDVASSLNNLAVVAAERGELDAEEAYSKRALALREKLVPDSLELTGTLTNLGNLEIIRGNLAGAEAYLKRALAIEERLAPAGLEVATSWSNLGLIASHRGDLATAESLYLRSLAIKEKLAPGSLTVARTLFRLGVIALNRGDSMAAESYYKRVLAIQEQLAPDGLDVAQTLTHLGDVMYGRGEVAAAEANYKRALAINERLSPESSTMAQSLHSLAILAASRGDLSTAEANEKRALSIHERLAPDGLSVSDPLTHLGILARQRGDLTASEAYLTRALAIRQHLSPGSSDEAESQYELGVVYRRGNQNGPAARHLLRAIDALEAQVGKLGGSQDLQSEFGARFGGYYRDYIELLVEQDKYAEAFHILERSRARMLLAMLVERDLVLSELPEELEQQRKRIAWEYDKTQDDLRDLNPVKDRTAIERLVGRLRELRESQLRIIEQIRRQSPRLASLQYPRPMDVSGVQAALDPGTLLLSYSVGKDKTYLFALTREGGVQVHTLASGETRLRAEIEQFRGLIQRAQLGAADVTGLADLGRRLYDLLIQPAAKAAERAHRVLIIPDGPLHVLPFAAVVRGVDAKAVRARRDWQYLVEWKPVHVAVSATVYAELQKERRKGGVGKPGTTVVAFGDPTYPAVAATTDAAGFDRHDPVVRSMFTRGYRFTALPATRHEVAAIAGLYRGQAETYVGEAATEERAKSIARATPYVHFASHGLLDERFPLNSGLALSMPDEVKEGQDNGILQAWEIFERVRIDAELVVLSACDSGLGKEMGGEGLVGLTRAFQYAGARSVLASQWSVVDDTTAVLMHRFYSYLKSGTSKDAALRQAQLDLIRESISIQNQNGSTKVDASHPFYWAAFQLNGDWK